MGKSMQAIINWVLILFFKIMAFFSGIKGALMPCEKLPTKIWIKEHVIEMWIDNLEGLPQPYNDVEIIRKHPILLRLRLWLAKRRIHRRNRKLTKFWLNNFVC